MDTDANARSRVAESETVTGFQIGLVCIGIAITLSVLYSAGELARSVGLSRGIIAVVLGSLILSVMSIPAAIVGAKTRLSSYMIIEHTFGYAGAKIVNSWFGLVLLGWYAVTAELFGRTLYLASLELTSLLIPEPVFTILSSMLVIATAVYGFKAIDRLALCAVPFLVFMLLVAVTMSLRKTPIAELLLIENEGLDMPTAISVVIGTMIVNVVLMPDLTRYARTMKHCVTASFLGNGGGIIISYVAAMIPVLVWNELDPMKYMFLMGFGGIALFVIVFATWTTNVVNLYSTSLAASASIPVGRYKVIVLISGILGTAIALIGVSEHLIDFLVVLSLLVPPIAGVYLSDFFILHRTDFSPARLEGRPPFKITALIAGIGGGVIAAWAYYTDRSLTGIAPLESLLVSVVLYLSMELALGKHKKDEYANRN